MEHMIEKLKNKEDLLWINPDLLDIDLALSQCELSMEDIIDAEKRLARFAPFIEKCFPETQKSHGIIESEVVEIAEMRKCLTERFDLHLNGPLYLKKDSHLAIAGSVKARGGIYEVLKHTEELALENHLLTLEDDYSCLTEYKDFFHQYTVQVGSTGNLGLSIGIMSAAVGYKVIVHMSMDAKKWKKDLLRSHGVTVVEYSSDYSEAVKQGRENSDKDPKSYFVDDENSRNLFLGYAVAALRLKKQFEEKKIVVDKEHPMMVYLPCGVGGAPGGIAFGLKNVFKDAVHCFFVEPTAACCMTLGLITGLNNKISVQDIGLDGLTEADGLAVGRASGFVGGLIKPLLSGSMTVNDDELSVYLKDIYKTEKVFLEPSACAGFKGVEYSEHPEMKKYLDKMGLNRLSVSHLVWATGGSLVPEEIRKEFLKNE